MWDRSTFCGFLTHSARDCPVALTVFSKFIGVGCLLSGAEVSAPAGAWGVQGNIRQSSGQRARLGSSQKKFGSMIYYVSKVFWIIAAPTNALVLIGAIVAFCAALRSP